MKMNGPYEIDMKTWEQWADKIDEARKREASGDLSNIAYQILNTFTTFKEEKKEEK